VPLHTTAERTMVELVNIVAASLSSPAAEVAADGGLKTTLDLAAVNPAPKAKGSDGSRRIGTFESETDSSPIL